MYPKKLGRVCVDMNNEVGYNKADSADIYRIIYRMEGRV